MRVYSNWLSIVLVMAIAATVLARPGPSDDRAAPPGGDKTSPSHPLRPSAWLGLRIGPLPRAVAVHIGLEDEEDALGVIVLNVIIESPADKAGLERDDVIIAVDGRPVLRDTVSFVQNTERYKVGDTIPLTVIRRGREQEVRLDVGQFKRREAKYKYPEASPAMMRFRNERTHVWQKGRDGRWRSEPGQTHMFNSLPPELRVQVEKRLPRAPEHGVSFSIRRNLKGRDIQIARDDEDQITVTQYGKNDAGEDQVLKSKTYANHEALLKDDYEAFRMYFAAVLVADGFAPGRDPERRRRLQALREQLRRYFRDHPEQREHGRQRMQDRPPWNPPHRRRPRPQLRFDVNEQGQIRIDIQHGEDKLRLTFKDEEEFQSKRPRLFRRYQQMVRTDEDG